MRHFLFWFLKICLSSTFKPLALQYRFTAVVLCVASPGQPHCLAVPIYDKDNKTSVMQLSLKHGI